MSRELIQKMSAQKISGGYLILLRLALGFAFLGTWFSNYSKGVFTPSGFIGTIEYFINDPSHITTPLDAVIRSVAFPNAKYFVIVHIVLEGAVALSLIFGMFCRTGSALGAFVSIFFMFGTLGVDWLGTYVLLIVGFLTCGLTSAGKWYGLDYWIKDKLPPTLAKILV